MTDAVSESMGDEHFIANVSAGLALYGVVVGRDGQKLEKPRRQVLRMPADCKLKKPSQEYFVRSGLSTDISTSDRFFETVSESGWSFALKLAGPAGLGFLAGGEIDAGGATRKLLMSELSVNRRRMEVWKMECHYVPRASFRIDKSQICLSEEALEDVRHLRTLGQAKAFLHTYGSHVPDREYHVGGILLHGAGVKSFGFTQLSTLIESASQQLPGITAGIFMSHVGEANASVSAEKLQTSTDWRMDESSGIFMKAYVRALGPNTADADEFVQKLTSDRSTWFIIDINEDAVLHAIWEVVGREAEGNNLRSQMKLLSTAWQISRSLGLFRDPKISLELLEGLECMAIEQLLQQMECCVLAELYGDHEASVPEAHSLQPLDIAKKLQKMHLAATSSDVFKKVKHNVGALLFKVQAFEELVTYVAQSTVEDMNAAKRVLRTILNIDLQQALKEERITLSREVKEMLELQDELEEFPPLEVPVPPAELPRMLESLVEKFRSSPEDTSRHAPLSEAVEKAIKACLRIDGCEKVIKVVSSFGFNEHGIFTGNSLTKAYVQSMIEDLNESLQQPLYQPVPLPVPDIRHTMTPYLWPSKSYYSYNSDIVVDRCLERNNVHEKMIDCIRHRVDPFSPPITEVEGAFDFSDNWGEDDSGFGKGGEDSFGSNTSKSGSHSNIVEGNFGISSPFLLLVQIMRKSDLTFQMALSKLLLEQRISVPLVLPQNGSRLGHILESLRYVEVKTTNQNRVSIYDDNALPRVIFASRRRDLRLCETAAMATEVLGCHFVSQHCNGELESGPVLELGVGFYPDTQPGQHLPCLAFCIWGDLQRLIEVVRQLGDIIVLECDNDSQKVPIEGLGSNKHLYWETNNSRNGLDKKNQVLWGSFKHVATGIRQYLKFQCAQVIKSSREALQLEECLRFIDSLQPIRHLTIIDKNFSSTMLMKSELLLQRSYAREAKFQFEAAKITNNPPQHRIKERACQEEKQKRQQLCAQISNLPILKLFVDLLSNVDPVYRRLSIVQMQRYFDQQNRMNFETTAGHVDKAFETFQNAPANFVGCQMLHDAKLHNVESVLGMEHLWRELCHIFIADPQKTNLPTLAAQHLLDGFPLEILDGEAGMYCKPWIDRVLLSLNNILTQHLGREPRIFVMSVVGLQSSGKSTFLNNMFGTQLQTSAGRCTRGVYLQLVKSDRAEYDYVVLLDTEGIRAPEFFGLEGSEAHDNRLATFAVLPADACVVVVSNEDDSGLKEVLSMVMLAYKGSAMTMNSGGWMPSKLFFVYRSIDTNDSDQLRSNQLKLQEHLQRAAFEVAGIREERSVQESVTVSKTHEQIIANDLINSVINFRVHQDADKSDVKYLGNLKKENMPPGDIPDWAYGTKVMQIREYIHKRVTERGAWHSHTLTDWGVYLGMVWTCITSADFELSFKSLVEFAAYEELTNILDSHRRAVTKKYDEEFEIFESNLHNQFGIFENSKVLTNNMLDNVEETIKKQIAEVEVLLSNPRWQKWKIQETNHWREYLRESRFHWSGRCQDSAGVLEFENVVKQYYQKLQLNIKALFKKKEIVMNKEHPELFQREVDNHFEDMFKRILQEVREKHKPLADNVPRYVKSVYARSEVSRLYNLQADERTIPQADGGFSLVSYASSLAHKVGGKGGPRLDLQDEGLQKMVDQCLADAIKYSNHIVEEVIRGTRSLLKARVQQSQMGSFWTSKNNQQSAHISVMRYLTDQLCAIQERWDVEHNVAMKLEQEKDRLRCFFLDCANEVGGSEMLAHAILDVLNPGRKSEKPINIMIEAFKPILIKEIFGTLETQEWLSNAKVFRALLDLHLLNMAEGGSNKEAELLKWTANGSEHYEFIMNTLLERELIKFWESHKPWESFLKRVKKALNHAAVAAETAYENSGLTNTGFKIPGLEPSKSKRAGLEHSGLKLFLSTLHDQFHSNVSKDLARAISSLSADVYDYCNLDYSVIETNIILNMDDAKLMPHLDTLFKQEIIKGVRDRLKNWSKSGAEPRCQQACPKCHLTCFKAAGHLTLHDTLHQPKGLVGIIMKAKKDKESDCQLSYTSCSRAIALNIRWEKTKDQRSFWSTKWAKYKDFSKYYPTWETPSDAHGQGASVREYIFYNHQAGIVKNFSGSKICTDIPPEYNHDPKELRIELENILKKHIKFEDSRTFI